MKALAAALLAAQSSLPDVRPDGVNPHFKSDYVTLDNLLRTIRPALNTAGIVLVQAPTLTEGQPTLTTTLLHAESGETYQSVMPLTMAKATAQEYGSALSYARRYALTALLGVAEADDDANAASNSGGEPREHGRPQGATGNSPAPVQSSTVAPEPSPPLDLAPETPTTKLVGEVLYTAGQLGSREAAHGAIVRHREANDDKAHEAWLKRQLKTLTDELAKRGPDGQASFEAPAGKRGEKASSAV